MTANCGDQTVYLITSGSYSDYYVNWVTSDADLAAKIEALGNFEVEPMDLITEVPKHKQFLTLMCRMDRMGVLTENESSWLVWNDYDQECLDRSRAYPPMQYAGSPVTFDPTTRGYAEFVVEVCGTDVERVRKVYSDRKAQWLAEKAGL